MNMKEKQLVNILMIGIGYILATVPYTNTMKPGLVRGVTWFVAGIIKTINN
jgi:uncharacterized membrane protein HdeD (DUF308 family)